MSLEEIKQRLNKKFKSDITKMGVDTKPDRVPFSSPRLNYLTRGGIPWPGATELSGPEGSGKAQPLDAQILTPNGFKFMKDIRVGDKVLGEDGQVHNVVGVYPQGIKPVYRITFSDGTSTKCCIDHLWTIQLPHQRQGNNKKYSNWMTVSVRWMLSQPIRHYGNKTEEEIKDRLAKGTVPYSFSIPITKPLNFEKQALPIDPYLLGVILGDGSIAEGNFGVSLYEQDMFEKVESLVKMYGCSLVIHQNSDYRIVGAGKGHTHPIKQIFNELRLCDKRSYEKFIPKQYLFSSIEDRIKLLQGLFDTDGCVERPGYYTFSSTSKQLIVDVKFLLQSLGCVCTVLPKKNCGYKNDGNFINCRDSWTIHISCPNDLQLYTSQKHKMRDKGYNRRFNVARYITDISYIGEEECQCIMTDNLTGLYLTNDCIVTHNTTLLNDLIKNAQKNGMMCAVVDNENKYDTDYAKWCGVDVDNLLLCQPINTAGEDVLQLVLDMLDEGINFCGIDSIASLVPKQVLQGSMDDKTYAGSSGIVSTFSQKISGTGILQAKKACLVGINQVRDKMSGFGLQTPGGHFWRHICTLRLQITRGNPFDAIYREMAMNTTEITSGYRMEVRVLKNQVCKNDRRFNYCTFHYEKGIDVLEDLIDVAIELGVIHQGGAWYRPINRETGEVLCVNGEELKFQGRGNLRDYLEENNRIAKWIEMQVNKYIDED